MLPRNDFLVFRPTTVLKGFTLHPAGLADASRCLHSILVLTGMSVEDTTRYSMHSCRHVYPTCAYQLLFPGPAATLMGHWAPDADKSSGVYDAARTATEFAYKANLAANVRAGWRPVPHGSVPQAAIFPLTGSPALPPLVTDQKSPFPAVAFSPKKPEVEEGWEVVVEPDRGEDVQRVA